MLKLVFLRRIKCLGLFRVAKAYRNLVEYVVFIGIQPASLWRNILKILNRK